MTATLYHLWRPVFCSGVIKMCFNRKLINQRLIYKSKSVHYHTSFSFFRNISSHEPPKSLNGIQSITKYLPRKKSPRSTADEHLKEGCWRVAAYAAAEEFDLEKLVEGLVKQGLYVANILPEDVEDALRITAKYKVSEEHREIYVFREGCVVFWNVLETERVAFINFLKTYADSPFSESLVKDENEIMEYSYADNGPRLTKGKFYLKQINSELDLVKYTFSNGLALSVKLGIWENHLDNFAEDIEGVADDLKQGKSIKLSRDQVLRKMGELFSLRHIINLSSDLLDTPDFYWEREELEPLFHKTCSHLNLAKRTRVLNEKLNHCQELMQLLDDHLTDQHHVRLEWMIISLITIEVIFELAHWML